MVKSSLAVGWLYDCGRCDKSHASFAGGVMVSEDGKFLTNHHVIQSFVTRTNHEGLFAMTSDGKCFQLDKVLAADKKADVALVQLKTRGHKFYAASIADKRPLPMDVVRVVSNPSMQFFVMTKGEVSRYVTSSKMGTRMEVTASYGAGSSGSGIFNEKGEIIGLVSSNRPLLRSINSGKVANDELHDPRKSKSNTTMYPEIILRRCTTHEAITNCFKQ
jgi:S1-C subfamily serine protease